MPETQLQSIDDILGPPPKQSIEDILGPAPGGPPPGKPGSPAIAAAYPNASVTTVATPQLAKAAAQAGGPTQPTPMAPPAPTDLSTQLLEKQGEAGLAGKYALTPPPPTPQDVQTQIPTGLIEGLQKPRLTPLPATSQQTLVNTYGEIPGKMLQGAGEFAQGLSSIANVATMGTLKMAPESFSKAAGYVFGADMLNGLRQQSPVLYQQITSGQFGDAAKTATTMGLSSLAVILTAKHLAGAADAVVDAKKAAADNPPIPNQSDLKALTSTPPEASAALAEKIRYQTEQADIAARVDAGTATQEEAARLESNRQLDALANDAGWDPMLPKPHESPQTVEGFAKTVELMKQGLTRTPSGDDVKPNSPVNPAIDGAVQEKLTKMGADPNDPQSVADVLADWKLSRLPADAAEARSLQAPKIEIDPTLQVSQTKGDTVSLPVDAPATAVVHELEHFGDRVGANFAPPEGDQNDTAIRFLLDGETPDRGVVLLEKAVPGIANWADSEPLRYQVAGNEFAADSEPTSEFNQRLQKLTDSLGRFITADNRTGSPEWAKDAMGDLVAPTKESEAWMVADKGLTAFEQKFSKLSRPEKLAWMDRQNLNDPHPEPWMDSFGGLYKKTSDYWWNEANDRKPLAYRGGMDPNDPEADGYFRTMWKGRWTGGAPGVGTLGPFTPGVPLGSTGGVAGTMGFFKEWSGKLPSELVAAGFEPTTYNPATMLKLTIADKARFVGMWDGMQGALDQGGIKSIPRGAAPPEGFVPVTSFKIRNFLDMMAKENAELNTTDPKTGLPGDYYMEPNFARMLNAYTSKNVISGTATGQAALWWKASSTAWALAGSLPHLYNTMNISSAHMLSSGLADIWTAIRGPAPDGTLVPLEMQEISEGVYGQQSEFQRRLQLLGQGAMKALGAMAPPVSAYNYIEKGGQLYRSFSSTDELLSRADLQGLAGNPMAKRAYDLLFASGGGLLYNETNTMDLYAAFREALQGDQYGKALVALLGLGEQKVSQLILTHATMRAVAQMKLYAYVDTASQLLEANADKIASGQISDRTLARQAWDHVDNLYGQIDYHGTWFWPKTLSAGMQLLLQAPGWRIGGVKAPMIAGRSLGQKLLEPLNVIAEGEEPLTMQNMMPTADPRTIFPLAMLWPATVMGSLMAYAATKALPDPQNLKDIIFPKTGGVDDRGHPNRLATFGYAKDWYNYANDPIGGAKHGLSGIIARTSEALNNKDFYGHQIYDPLADKPTQFVEGGVHALAGMPYAAQGVSESLERNSDRPTPQKILGVAEALTANRPASTKLDNTSAEDMIDKIFESKRSEIGVADQVFENRQLQRKWVQKLREATPETKQKVLNEISSGGGVASSVPSAVLLRKTATAAAMPPGNGLFSLLSWDEMAKVWPQTTPQERAAWGPIFLGKLTMGAKSPEDVQKKVIASISKSNFPNQTLQKWQSAWQLYQGSQAPPDTSSPPAINSAPVQ